MHTIPGYTFPEWINITTKYKTITKPIVIFNSDRYYYVTRTRGDVSITYSTYVHVWFFVL